MKISIFRTRKNGGESIVNEGFDKFINRIKQEAEGNYISRYREVLSKLDEEGHWMYKDRIHTLCAVSEYYRNKAGQPVWRCYNGISVLTIDSLNNKLEVNKVKRQAALFPQTLCAMMGADGHSVHIFTIASLPQGTLPREEKMAKLFCAQAYATSVRCLQPSLEFPISIEEPTLDKRIMLTLDEEPYVNPNPTPFIIEQPTEETVRRLIESGDPQNKLERMKPSAETYVSFTNLYNNAYKRVLQSLADWKASDNPFSLIERVAEECADCGLPEEEVAQRLVWHFHKEKDYEVRDTVHNIYVEYKGQGEHLPMSKHQYVAFRLREFLQRRYEIRYNEVLCMTEFRPRMSLQFMFRELDRRRLNAIHHEACIEGIEPAFSEVDNLIHSSFTPIYNPIQEYLEELPRWDGKDRLKALAQMVPNNNPNWERLFCRWFLSMVAHWMNCDSTRSNQTAPILIGVQGYRKSTFCRLLLPPELQQFFTDSIDFRSNVEAERCLSRFLLVNIDEFDQLSEKQFAYVKHLFQKPVTNIRRMYSETIGTQRRYASFIGTSNQNEILRDPTGNRRYICVEVTAPIRVEEPIDYQQLYAQAKHLILHGERYYLNDEDEALLRISNQRFEVETKMEQLFCNVFELPQSEADGTWMSATEILEALQAEPTFDKKTDNSTIKLGFVLKKFNVKKDRQKTGYRYLVKMR